MIDSGYNNNNNNDDEKNGMTICKMYIYYNDMMKKIGYYEFDIQL